MDEDTFILDAAAEAGLHLPLTYLQGWCVTCVGRVVEGSAARVDNSAARRHFVEDTAAAL